MTTANEIDRPAERRGGRMRVPRTRGALTGLLLILLGLWGAFIPFVGPYFDYSYTPDSTWTWTAGRFWLEVLPGGVTVLCGLILLLTANRASAALAGWLASAAGAWFVVGATVSQLWGGQAADAGSPLGGTKRQVIEQLGFFSALGVVIVFFAAQAAGRVTVRAVRDLEPIEPARAPSYAPVRESEPTRVEHHGRREDTIHSESAARSGEPAGPGEPELRRGSAGPGDR